MAIPGVGRKLAERMIVELKDKFATFAPAEHEARRSLRRSQMMLDAVSASINLGYKKPEIGKRVAKCSKRGDFAGKFLERKRCRRMSP